LHYVGNAVKNFEEWMVKQGIDLPKKAPAPMSSTYKLKVYVSPELSPEMAKFYQSQVGFLIWIIEMRRLDITTEVSISAALMAAPKWEASLRGISRVCISLEQTQY
jgi:hypothetical protein